MPFPKDLKAIFVAPLVISIVAVITAMLIPVINRDPPISGPKHEMMALKAAIRAYQYEFMAMPTHDVLLRSLGGDNPRKIIFLEWPNRSIGASGQPIDPWGTDYRIEMTTNGITVTSAGKNKSFGDEDDITTDNSGPNHRFEGTAVPRTVQPSPQP